MFILPLKFGSFPLECYDTFNRCSLNFDFICIKIASQKSQIFLRKIWKNITSKPKRSFLGFFLETELQVKPCRALWTSSYARKRDHGIGIRSDFKWGRFDPRGEIFPDDLVANDFGALQNYGHK